MNEQIGVRRSIEEWIDKYGQATEEGRSASFDCFNYFQAFRERGCISAICEPENIQVSCLQLAFYVASWGMLRGSSGLLQKSAKFYEPLIAEIGQSENEVWGIDVDSYSRETIDLLLRVKDRFANILAGPTVNSGVTATDTLVTKIMLGVYGNIPAFDTYFQKGLHVSTVNPTSLTRIAQFYQDHQREIDGCAPIYTLDFRTGRPTRRRYTKAKMVDMIGHMSGWWNARRSLL